MKVTRHVFISGRVQNVGFRHFTQINASDLGVKGWVRNLDDGRVEAVFHGEEEVVKEMIERVWNGPRYSKVAEVEVEEIEQDTYSSFSVRYS
jgi:acylphosphatase